MRHGSVWRGYRQRFRLDARYSRFQLQASVLHTGIRDTAAEADTRFETASTVSSRGVYMFPMELKAGAKYPNHQSSGYDTEFCSWSNIPDVDFSMDDDYPPMIGQFVCSGFDYLGEPSPYDTDSCYQPLKRYSASSTSRRFPKTGIIFTALSGIKGVDSPYPSH